MAIRTRLHTFQCFLRGRRVTSLGVLFNFTSNAANTTVQFVADMVKESWVGIIRLVGAFLTLAQFAEAIAEEPDVFLLVGCVFSLRSLTFTNAIC